MLSGGEPLLNAEWPQLCSIFRQEGIRVTLLTTGLLLGKQASLVAEFFDDVIVSLDGPDRIHDANPPRRQSIRPAAAWRSCTSTATAEHFRSPPAPRCKRRITPTSEKRAPLQNN